jgi:hypothetical protein
MERDIASKPRFQISDNSEITKLKHILMQKFKNWKWKLDCSVIKPSYLFIDNSDLGAEKLIKKLVQTRIIS